MKDKDLSIILKNYLVLIDSILSQTNINDNGAIVRLKTDRLLIIKYLGELEKC